MGPMDCLANTGSSVDIPFVLIAGVLLAAGVFLLVLSRKKIEAKATPMLVLLPLLAGMLLLAQTPLPANAAEPSGSCTPAAATPVPLPTQTQKPTPRPTSTPTKTVPPVLVYDAVVSVTGTPAVGSVQNFDLHLANGPLATGALPAGTTVLIKYSATSTTNSSAELASIDPNMDCSPATVGQVFGPSLKVTMSISCTLKASLALGQSDTIKITTSLGTCGSSTGPTIVATLPAGYTNAHPANNPATTGSPAIVVPLGWGC